MCWPSLGLCAFDVTRIRGAALCVDLYVQSRIMLLPELGALGVCWKSIRSCALNFNQSPLGWTVGREPIWAVPDYVQSGLCALDVCWSRLGVFSFDVNRTGCAVPYVGLYVQSRIVLLPGVCALYV